MSSNIPLIFLIIFTAEISLGNAWMYPNAARKVEFSDAEKNQVRDLVKEFLDWVTLNETTTFWNMSDFHECFNNKSDSYNFLIADVRSGLMSYLDKYNRDSRYVHQYLIEDLKSTVQNMTDLIDQARSNVYLKTQKTPETKVDNKKVKESMEESKKQIENCFIKLNEIVWSIKKSASLDNQKTALEETKKKIEEEFGKIKSSSIEFVENMKKCTQKGKK